MKEYQHHQTPFDIANDIGDHEIISFDGTTYATISMEDISMDGKQYHMTIMNT
jgi:hypothetical protein